MKNKFVYIDLFTGCGGLSLGLFNSGWKGLFAVEKSKDAFMTLKHNMIDEKGHYNWPNWLPMENHDINEVIENYKPELEKLRGTVTMVAGGPPCQGFSSAGRRNESDERNKLVDSYIEFVSIVRPELLFFENVRGFTIGFKKKKKRGKAYSEYVKKKLEDLGYKVKGEIIDFSDFGVPQRRQRFILVGSLKSDPQVFFDKIIESKRSFLKSKGLSCHNTLEDAISDLLYINGAVDCPDSKGFKAGLYSHAQSSYQRYIRAGMRLTGKVADSHRFAKHNKDTLSIFQKILNNAEKNKRISGDLREIYGLKKRGVIPLDERKVSPTLTTHPDDYIHYSEARILTVREYARIQTFPDWYEIKGKYTTGGENRVKEVPRYTQLGNAIPPLFGEQAGLALKELVHDGE